MHLVTIFLTEQNVDNVNQLAHVCLMVVFFLLRATSQNIGAAIPSSTKDRQHRPQSIADSDGCARGPPAGHDRAVLPCFAVSTFLAP